MIGAAGSGKSTSLETVMDEEPPAEEDRESTPLLKRPVQTEVIFVDKNVKWEEEDTRREETIHCQPFESPCSTTRKTNSHWQ